MTDFLGIIDLSNVTESQKRKPLPVGRYGAKITKAEIKPTKANNGHCLHLEFLTVGAKNVKGRFLKDYIVVKHENDQATEIGLRKLKKILKSIGQDQNSFSNPEALIGELVGLNVIIENSEQYGDQNKLKSVFEFSDDLLDPPSNNTFEDIDL